MTRSSFAPELSATLSRVSCWTTSLSGLLDDLEYAPALLLGDRPRLGDAHQVAHAALVLLVVDLELGALLNRLAVQAMGLGRADLHDHGLVHLVCDDGAQPDLAPASRRSFGRLDGGVGHSGSSFLARRPRFGLASTSLSSSTSSGASATATADAAGAWACMSLISLGPMPKSRSRSTVMMRAMSCRTLEIWLEFSSCPTACLKRSS